jgi:hypothetical protein
MRRAVFISAGLLKPKKPNALATKHLYLNFGLLSLATKLAADGWETRLFHGGFALPEAVACRIAGEMADEPSCPIFLSLPSFLAIPWARLFACELHRLLPSAPLIIGGQWVVAAGGRWIRSRIPEASLVVFGTAESRISVISNSANWHAIPGTDINDGGAEPLLLDCPTDLDYRLVDHYHSYQPSIEVSRGCPMKCRFCPESGRHGAMVKPNLLIKSLDRTVMTYATEEISPYFEASFFAPSDAWIADFQSAYSSSGHQIRWRCESRADLMKPHQLGKLAAAGLKVLDIGLESASPSQLTAMGKAHDPVRYLRRASELLKACGDHGVWAKINILLYAGETRGTIAETTDWLEAHRRYIKGLSVGPVVIYGPMTVSGLFVAELGRYGARVVDESSLERFGVSDVHLSAELDDEAAVELSGAISRAFMCAEDYFDLKSFSYFPRDYTYVDFLADACTPGREMLPFSFTGNSNKAPAATAFSYPAASKSALQ